MATFLGFPVSMSAAGRAAMPTPEEETWRARLAGRFVPGADSMSAQDRDAIVRQGLLGLAAGMAGTGGQGIGGAIGNGLQSGLLALNSGAQDLQQQQYRQQMMERGMADPAGLREFSALTEGLPEEDVQRARRIRLGLEGRASSSGFQQVKFTGPDGRERVGVMNGRTGRIDLPDGTSFDPAAVQITDVSGGFGMAPAMAPGEVPFSIDPSLPPEVQESIRANPQQWAQADAVQIPQASAGNPFVSRAPEEQAAATTAAQQAAELRFLPTRQAIETQGAVDRTRQIGQVENDLAKSAGESKARLSLDQATSRIGRVDALVDSIMPRINNWTAGTIGSIADAIPGTPAADLRRDLGTLQAIAGFDELNAMRAASPTGGALGNVTERELAFLQSVVRNIENSQSPEQLRRNLQAFQREIRQSWERVSQAYEQDYGSRRPAAPQNPAQDIDALLEMYR